MDQRMHVYYCQILLRNNNTLLPQKYLLKIVNHNVLLLRVMKVQLQEIEASQVKQTVTVLYNLLRVFHLVQESPNRFVRRLMLII